MQLPVGEGVNAIGAQYFDCRLLAETLHRSGKHGPQVRGSQRKDST
jgi:hypothetical protein